ncbi:protein MICROTUBULE BINDING PROTEIN 2C-like [Silene latifolia]|uniref:protein MICROTUBULE BINDING PROTEIN 2C-like n=1 Tax=Silene latifolia TaxID=37657 RepID=UPI003D7727DC
MNLTRKGYVEMKEKSSLNFNEEIPTSNPNNNNLDRNLYNDLVQIVPLVQSLIESKPNKSFTRRVPLIYTKTPKDSRKNGVKSPDGKKHDDKEQGGDSKSDQDKDREELNALRKQLEELQQQLLEKDELLKVAEVTKSQASSVQSQFDELKRTVAEKNSLIKSSQSQLNDAKIKLADKQAALEKLQWETMTSNQKVEKLQQELESMQSQVSALMLIFEGLLKDTPVTATDYDVTPYFADHLSDIDELDENEIQNMEEAREAYLAAVELAKEKQDEESLLTASRARFYLQSFVFRTKAQT